MSPVWDLAQGTALSVMADPVTSWVLLGTAGATTALAGLLLHRARTWRKRAYEADGELREQANEIDALGEDIALTRAERDSAIKAAEAARAYNSRLLDEIEKTEVNNAGLATRLTAEEHHKVALQGALDRRNAYRRRQAREALPKLPGPDVVITL